MPYISTYDRLVREEGRQEGWQEGRREGQDAGLREGRITALREMLVEDLTQRFGSPSADLVARLDRIQDEAHLRRLIRAAIMAVSLESFAQGFSTH